MSFPLGQPITATFLVYSDAARTVLADTEIVTVDVLDSAGGTTTYSLAGGTVTHASTGTYKLTYTAPTGGLYGLHWQSAGTVVTSHNDWFYVDPKWSAPTLATEQDLQDYLQNSTLDANAALLALTLATALIQNETRQHLFYVANDTVILAGGSGTLYLPQRPVVDTPVANGMVPSTLYRYDPPDRLTYGVPSGNLAAAQYANGPEPVYGRWPLQVSVTYSHGYQTIPDDLRAVCLSVASRAVTNPQGLRGETLGPYQIQYAGGGDILTAGVALTAAERMILSRYRARNRSLVTR